MLKLAVLLLVAVIGDCSWAMSITVDNENDGVSNEPYCYYNITKPTNRTVLKTRVVEKKPTGIFRALKKTKYITESYEDIETTYKVELVRLCCEGYKMSALQVCEPVCLDGCPANAHCFEPNKCRCSEDYIPATSHKDGTRHCEAICVEPCPPNSYCAKPNICKCSHGYRWNTDKNICEPHCSSECNDVGICIKPESCHCPANYRAVDGTCLLHDGSDEYKADADYAIENTTEFEEDATDSFETTDEFPVEWYEIPLPTGEPMFSGDCADGYVFFNGTCLVQTFPSNTVDCNVTGCDEHSTCQANGTCTCDDGFIRHNIDVNANDTETTTSTVVLKAVCIDPMELLQNIFDEREMNEYQDWVSLVVVGVVTVLIIVAILISLIALHRRRGRMNVQRQQQQQSDVTFKYNPPPTSSNEGSFVY